MKGKGLIFFAAFATLAGAVTAILLVNANQTIGEHVSTITQNKKEINALKSDNASLETDKEELTVKLNTADSNLKSTETKLSNLTNEHYESLKKIEIQSKVEEDLMEQIFAKDKKISALNGELQTAQNKNRDYGSQIKVLNSQLVTKDQAIEDISRRLESTTEDRDHLLRERDKLIAEKAELEKQFQDIVVLRQKVQQLQVELMASKKLEWLRRGFYGGARQKGGARLMGMNKKQKTPTDARSADLNVEVRRDGTVKIVPVETNSPPDGATP